jgi:hypothetical protein
MQTLQRLTYTGPSTVLLIAAIACHMCIASIVAQDDVVFDFVKEFRGDAEAGDMALDYFGNMYVVGGFTGQIDFDPGLGTAILIDNGEGGAFVSKSEPTGNLLWAVAMGGTNPETDFALCTSVATDVEGNVYTTGHFEGTIDFDPGEETAELTGFHGFRRNIFIHKLDSAGNFIWVKAIRTLQFDDFTPDIAIDALGNVYTSGLFLDTIDFDPGEGIFNLTSTPAGLADIFVQKLNSNGDFVWAKSMGGTDFDNARAIAVDSSGNVYTTGRFGDNADFDPGPETTILDNNGPDVFVSKLDTDGNYEWAKAFRGRGNFSVTSTAIAIDHARNVYTTGFFRDYTDFDPGDDTFELMPMDNEDIFVSRLDPNGNFVWAGSMNLRDFDVNALAGVMGSRSMDISLDFEGKAYITGEYDSQIFRIPHFVAVVDTDIFVSKWSADGIREWIKIMHGSSFDRGTSIAIDPSANVFSTGFFSEDIDFDPGPEDRSVNSNGVYVHKLSSGRFGVITRNLTAAETIKGERFELNAPIGAARYQWSKNGQLLADADAISGTTTPTLIIDPLSMDDSGVYSCLYEKGVSRSLLQTEGINIIVRDNGGGGGGNCLIAHLAHGTPLHNELDTLRAFRDHAMLNSPLGSSFANVYYQASPTAIAASSSLGEFRSPIVNGILILLLAACVFTGLRYSKRRKRVY